MATNTHCHASTLTIHTWWFEPKILYLDSSIYQTCCHLFSVVFLCNLACLSLFLPPPPQRPFLISTTVNGTTEGPDASFGPPSGLHWIFSCFLRTCTNFRYCSTDAHFFLACCFFDFSTFLKFFFTLHKNMPNMTSFSSLGITVLVQKYYFLRLAVFKDSAKEIVCLCITV